LSSYETTAHLDTETGAVIFVEDYVVDQLEELFSDEEDLEAIEAVQKAKADLSETDRQQLLDAARVEGDDNYHYRMIPKQDSREGYRDMQDTSSRLRMSICANCLKLPFKGRARFGASRMCCIAIQKQRKTGSNSAMSAKNGA
jgi:hypothetical protein